MDIKDIEVGKTYRFVNKDSGPNGLIIFDGAVATVRAKEEEVSPYPLIVDLAKGTMRFNSLSAEPAELEEL